MERFERLLRSLLDPEQVSYRAKGDLGLMGAGGTNYTETLTVYP